MNLPVSEMRDLSILKQIMDTNFYGSVASTVFAMPHLLAAGRSRTDVRILVISSVAGLTGTLNRSGYSASKFALHGFFDSLRLETGFPITLACPGWVRTDLDRTRL